MATFYGYRGYIGCDGFKAGFDIDAIEEGEMLEREYLSDALINDPLDEGQLGFVLHLDKCRFNQEAINVLRHVQKSNDDTGEVDIFSSVDGSIVEWLGGVLTLIGPETTGSNSYDPKLLDSVVPVELDVPEGLKEYIDTILQMQEDKKQEGTENENSSKK